MRKLQAGELAIQLWSERDPSGEILIPIIHSIIELIQQVDTLGSVVGSVEGPTTHLPDFFRPHIHGRIQGYLIYTRDTPSAFELKDKLSPYELDPYHERWADIDVLLNEYIKVSMKNGRPTIVSILEQAYS